MSLTVLQISSKLYLVSKDPSPKIEFSQSKKTLKTGCKFFNLHRLALAQELEKYEHEMSRIKIQKEVHRSFGIELKDEGESDHVFYIHVFELTNPLLLLVGELHFRQGNIMKFYEIEDKILIPKPNVCPDEDENESHLEPLHDIGEEGLRNDENQGEVFLTKDYEIDSLRYSYTSMIDPCEIRGLYDEYISKFENEGERDETIFEEYIQSHKI
jgi:hypothetical protein